MYQLSFSRDPHDLFFDFHLLNVSKTVGELGQKKIQSYLLAKFTKCFRQVKQVKVLN